MAAILKPEVTIFRQKGGTREVQGRMVELVLKVTLLTKKATF